MGNVPVVRLEPHGVDRIDFVIGRLLDEVLKDFCGAVGLNSVAVRPILGWCR